MGNFWDGCLSNAEAVACIGFLKKIQEVIPHDISLTSFNESVPNDEIIIDLSCSFPYISTINIDIAVISSYLSNIELT